MIGNAMIEQSVGPILRGRPTTGPQKKIRAETARISLDGFAAGAVAYLLATGTF